MQCWLCGERCEHIWAPPEELWCPCRYELPQYGSRRRLLSPSGMYDEYGEVVVESDGGYYYSPHGPAAEEVRNKLWRLILSL